MIFFIKKIYCRQPRPPNAKQNSNSKRQLLAKVEMSTTEIINEFVSLVDTDKVYSLKELKDVLSEIYKAKSNGAKKSTKKTKVAKDTSDVSSDEEIEKDKKKTTKKDANKPKKAPSAYNNYVKIRIEQLKVERKDVAPRDLMKLAAADWKQLDKQTQATYKL
jgi:hypothetical protein